MPERGGRDCCANVGEDHRPPGRHDEHHRHDHRQHPHETTSTGACCGGACAAGAPPAGAATRAGAARLTFKVAGLDCAEEVALLKAEVGPLVGGPDKLAFDVIAGRMTVLHGAGEVPAGDILAAVARTGLRAQHWRAGQATATSDDRSRGVRAWFTALSGAGVLSGLALHVWLAGSLAEAWRLFDGHEHGMPWPETAAYAVAVAFGIRFVVPKAWLAARRLRPDINLLMVIAVAGAIAIGEWFEAATVAFLFALSLALEGWSVGRARHAIAALLELAPATVHVTAPDGAERDLDAADVPPGSVFVVRPGERIPLDGTVVSGASGVDQAPITGESMPVRKAAGAAVFAGTINGDGALAAMSTKAADDTMLARIIRMVEEAHGRRAAVEQWVERFARIYTPAVIALAVAVVLLPPLAFGAAWSDWFYRALVLLVIGCPCALVISTPVGIVAALAAAARRGVLVKGGVFIEQPARLRAVAFDKTGTLTRGAPGVVAVVPLNDHTADELLARAAALESLSTHPLARAISDHARRRNIPIEAAGDVQALRGKGMTGTLRGAQYWLGSHRYLVEQGRDTPEVRERAAALERDGKTVVAIWNDRHVCGLLAIADRTRRDAADLVRALRAAGIAHLVMLTGDNRTTAQAVAREVGIDEVHAELLPEDKVRVVEDLVATYGAVAMVGDGVNDAPAMARATLGIAMAAAGSDAAIETADIALLTDDLARLPWLVGHSRRTLGVIRQNIAFALAVKAAFALLTVAGHATLWGAIAADVGASLLVVANALRLLRSAAAPLSRDETSPQCTEGMAVAG